MHVSCAANRLISSNDIDVDINVKVVLEENGSFLDKLAVSRVNKRNLIKDVTSNISIKTYNSLKKDN